MLALAAGIFSCMMALAENSTSQEHLLSSNSRSADSVPSMKTVLVAILVILASSVLAMPAPADSSNATPEFYFTRLIYSGGRGGFRSNGSSPKLGSERSCASLERGEGGRGGGGSWSTDYPASDCKFMWGVERLTGLRVYDQTPHSVAILDPDLFKYPYVYVVEPGHMELSDEEVVRLREYMNRGGFVHFDDFWGLRERANLEFELGRILPGREIRQLDLKKEEVFHTFFDVDTVMQIPNVSNGCNGGPTWERSDDTVPRIYGVSDDTGRLMSIITYNSDLGDAWEWMDRPCYPEMYSSQAYRMGINFIIYSMSH
jgi:uncharacterized protein DUF4159